MVQPLRRGALVSAADILRTFQYAVANKSTVEILHKGQSKWVKAEPHTLWPSGDGASGTMLEISGGWPRTFRFAEMLDARIFNTSDHDAAESATGVQ
jgi:hypothetical protein